MIVTPSDFKGMIVIPQIQSAVNTGVESVYPVNDRLDTLINQKEPEVFTELFGYNFYKLFKDGLSAGGPEQRWKDLRDGKEWQDGEGKYHFFPGVKTLAARYIYYWYLRQEATQTTGVGESKNDTENARRTSPIQKQVTAWNDMVKMVESTYYFLHNNSATYPEWEDQPFWYHDFCYYWYLGFNFRWRKSNLLTPINTLNI